MRLDASVSSILSLPVNGSAVPVVLTRAPDRSRVTVYDLEGRPVGTVLGGAGVFGLAPHAEGFVLADARSDAMVLGRYRRSGRNLEKVIEARGSALPRNVSLSLVGMSVDPKGIVLFGSSGDDLQYHYWSDDDASSGVLFRGRPCLAALPRPIDPDGDGRLDYFLITAGPQVVRLVWDHGFEVLQDYALRNAGPLEARAAAGADREIWVVGTEAGQAAIYLLDPEAQPAVRSFKDLMRDPKSGRRNAAAMLLFGPGSFDKVAILDSERFVVGGTKSGRAYVGIFRRDPRMTLLHEATLPGTAVKHLVVNETRCGWSIGVQTDDLVFRRLRATDDSPLPRRWDPWSSNGGGAEPPGPPGPPSPPQAGGGAWALFPRVEVDRHGTNTEFYLVHMGARPAEIRLRGHDDAGRQVFAVAVPMRKGQRARISVAQALVEQRLNAFSGYVIVEGAPESDLVLEGYVLAPDSDNLTLMPHWRR